jgi:signal peptidase I
MPRRANAGAAGVIVNFDDADFGLQPRGTLARIGLTLMNIFQPGLGLLRLSKWRLALAFWLLSFTAIAILLLGYHLIRTMTFTSYFSLLAVGLFLSLIAVFGSMFLTWKHSRHIETSLRWWSRWYSLVAIAVVGSILSYGANGLKSYYKNYYIPAESMSPSLEVGDKLLAQMSDFGDIKRGDVLIVKAGSVDYVKRVVALPGDTFSMKDGIVYINGNAIIQKPLETKSIVDSYSETLSVRMLSEQLPGEKQPHRIADLGYSQGDDWEQTKLAADQYFFLGDNRDKSADSRYGNEMNGLGIVSRDRILGRVLFRYWRKGSGYGEGKI